jgi:hypothetical protein
MIIVSEYNSPERESNKNPASASNNRLTVWRR